ncbi:hypothetical protein B0H14DRAFT_3898863 [Mycena olivaceomarginata]|nr:hypothetical protein B0H14DRAFT_3898863 [Mycena olivaceomarginata]
MSSGTVPDCVRSLSEANGTIGGHGGVEWVVVEGSDQTVPVFDTVLSTSADILSVLAMTYSDTQPRGTLRYRLLSASLRPAGSPSADPGGSPAELKIIGTIEDLRALAKECTVFFIGHNAEPDVVDLLEELEIVDEIAQLVDDNTYNRVCQYMIRLMKRQLTFLLAHAQTPIEWLRTPFDNPDEEADIDDEFPEDLRECLSNTRMSGHFRDFGSSVSRTPRALRTCTRHILENTRLNTWDTDLGLSYVDKYTYSSEEYMKAGALLATGILNSGVRTEADVAKGLIGEYVDNKSVPLKMSGIIGLGLAYAGSHREDLLQLLIPHISDDGVTIEIVSLATLALRFIFVGSENGEITGTILQTLMEKAERGDTGLDEKWARYIALGLGLLYLGLQDASDTTIETLKAIEYPISKTAQIVVEAYVFTGTGNVLKVQAMLHHCDEHIDMKEKRRTRIGLWVSGCW